MRGGLFASLLLLASCAKPYKHLSAVSAQFQTKGLNPQFETELYRCTVDGQFLFRKFHLSGLIYFKNFSDTATRIIFQNEMGMTYFDFGWDAHDSFQVNYITEQ